MRFGHLVAMAVGIILLCGFSPSWAQDLTAGSCEPRDAVEATERESYEKAAIDFVSELVSGSLSKAHASLTDELRNYLPFDQFVAITAPNADRVKSLTQLHVNQSYLVQTGFMTGKAQFVICGTSDNVPMSSPQGRAFVMATNVPKQAHVLVDGSNQAGTWTFSLWMVPEHGGWRIHGLHEAPPSVFDKSESELWVLAKDQQSKGHALNAYLLYGLVSIVAYRGPNFQLGLWAESQKEANDIVLPPELQGVPPFLWQFDKSVFRVMSVRIAPDGRQLGLEVSYQADPKSDRKHLEDQNRILIRGLRRAHADYLDGFESIIVEAVGDSGERVRSIERAH